MQSQFFSQRGILGARTGMPEGSEEEVNIQYIRTKGGAPKHQQHSLKNYFTDEMLSVTELLLVASVVHSLNLCQALGTI